ncbi:Transmembrane protein 50A [Phytophthora citrophthora]|uniref:Transmembrane protein 50A n=1 Tax=Phytophthora citrophthora TaxID=4793 RepID=A0AAD9GW39_9STRA|nr:Transmembrane protein 50A [Phytophthora citrophthora]
MGLDPGKTGSYAAGLLLGVGWWILADGAASAVYHESKIPFDFVKYLPGIVSTLAFFLVNTVDWGMLTEDARFAYGSDVATRAKCFVVFCMALSIASLVGSVLVFAHTYVNNEFHESAWPGAAIVFQNGFIVMATFVMRVGMIAAAS